MHDFFLTQMQVQAFPRHMPVSRSAKSHALNTKFILLASSHALLLQDLRRLQHGAASSLQFYELMCHMQLTG